jgi:protein gp37
MVFVNSMSDLFHERVPTEFIAAVWDTMERAPSHQFQVLTKRPERMARFLSERAAVAPNVWVGTSVESGDYVSRLDQLRAAPAAVRFVSFEPLLSRIRKPNLSGFSWVIVGGESGPGARPLEEAWVLDLLSATKRQNAAFFFKQWGGPIKKRTGRLLQGREWSEFPSMARTQSKVA